MSYDPLDAATEAGERAGILWGKVLIDGQFVVLEKGRGKVPFDPQIHSQDRRVTNMTITINPLDATGLTRTSERQMLAESKTWYGIVWASARALGLTHARDLHGKWAKIELAKTGRTYSNKQGETVEETTFKFLAIFDSEADCLAAYQSAAPAVDDDEAHNAHDAENPEKEAMKGFLPVLVKQSGGDKDKLATLIAGMIPLNKYFTVDSPEVQELLKAV